MRRRPTSTRPTRRRCSASPRTRPRSATARKVIILGGGPNRIGQGIEFDYCCCHAAFALGRDGAGLRDDHGQLQPGDGVDRPGHLRPPLFRAADRRGRARDRPRASRRRASCSASSSSWAGRRRSSSPPSCRRRGCRSSAPRPTAIDLAEDRERFARLVEQLGLQQPRQRHRPQPRRGAARSPSGSAIRCCCGRPTCSAGGRWRWSTGPQQLDHYIATAVAGVGHIAGADRPLSARRDRGRRRRHLRRHGRRRSPASSSISRKPGVHSGDSACSIPPLQPVGRGHRRDRAPDRARWRWRSRSRG